MPLLEDYKAMASLIHAARPITLAYHQPLIKPRIGSRMVCHHYRRQVPMGRRGKHRNSL